jgi:hypothetical protein
MQIVVPSTRLEQPRQFWPHTAAQVSQDPLLQLFCAPTSHTPHDTVSPQPSSMGPQVLPAVWQVVLVQVHGPGVAPG